MEQKHIQANDLIKAILPPLNYVKLDQFLVNELPVKFLIVRHPFHRLLSAYIDKFEVRIVLTAFKILISDYKILTFLSEFYK